MDIREEFWRYCPRPIKQRARYIVRLGMLLRLPAFGREELDLGIVRAARNILLVALVILVSDAAVTYFAGAFLSNVFFLLRMGVRESFADLLFIEGIVALAIGGFNIGGISESHGIKGIRATSDRARRIPEQRKGLREDQTSSGIRLLAVGAILIGLSLSISFLPL